MSTYALSRIALFPNTARTVVVTSANILATKPDIAMQTGGHGHGEVMSLPSASERYMANSLKSSLLVGNLKVTNSFTKSASYRHLHTDLKVPNFDEYRNKLSKDPSQSSKDLSDDKQTFSYVSTFGVGVVMAYTAKAIVRDMVANVAPAADVLAMSQCEVKLSDIPEGKNITVKWRSKPLFVRHRTQQEIDSVNAVNLSDLRDPETDDQRTKNPKWLVVIGICTHLGCVPIPNAGEFNGYFCPCHGSHYDASGRIRKGPAPLNLEIPTYEFVDEDLLVVG